MEKIKLDELTLEDVIKEENYIGDYNGRHIYKVEGEDGVVYASCEHGGLRPAWEDPEEMKDLEKQGEIKRGDDE